MFTFEKCSTLIQLIPDTVSCGPFVSRGAAWRHLWAERHFRLWRGFGLRLIEVTPALQRLRKR
jgi:hypothetical protein